MAATQRVKIHFTIIILQTSWNGHAWADARVEMGFFQPHLVSKLPENIVSKILENVVLLILQFRLYLSNQFYQLDLSFYIFLADGSGSIMIRGCALDSGTLTTDTELIRMSHCGSFFFNEK